MVSSNISCSHVISLSFLAQLHPLWDRLAAISPVILLPRPAALTLLRLGRLLHLLFQHCSDQHPAHSQHLV